MLSKVRELLTSSLNLLIPTECHICEKPTWGDPLCATCEPGYRNLNSQNRCEHCWSVVQGGSCTLCVHFPFIFDALRYIWEYREDKRLYIHAMKYRPSIELTQIAGELLSRSLLTLYPKYSWDYILSIPCSPSNLARRGFNQSEIIAREIFKNNREQIDRILPNIIVSNSHKIPQSTKKPEERLKGLREAFRVKKQFKDSRILLVDDVLTTGVTVSEISSVLKDAGALSIDILVLAKVPEFQKYRASLYTRFHSPRYGMSAK